MAEPTAEANLGEMIAAECGRLRVECSRLRALLAEAEKVIEPFASNAEGRKGWLDDGFIGGTAYPPLTNGHLRAAADLRKKLREALKL